MARVIASAMLLLLASASLTAVTTWKGLQPGASRRADVDRVLGPPTRSLTDSIRIHNPQEGTGQIVVEYAADVVVRIEIDLTAPLDRAALVETFALASIASTKKPTGDGALAEYFAGDASLVLFYAGTSEASGVNRVGFYSREQFERASGTPTTAGSSQPSGGDAATGLPPIDGTGPGAAPPAPADPAAAPPPAAPPVLEWSPKVDVFNPAECQDIYYWAQREQDVARRAKNAPRRQQILDILITSQRGECTAARTKAEQYKQVYR